MYQVDSHLLCLSCFSQLQQAQAAMQRAENEKAAQRAAHLNYLSDMMAWTVGLPPSGPHIQIPQPVLANINKGPTLNYISIDRSVIGMLNTGSIQDVQRIDINVRSLVESGSPEVAIALKALTEAVASNQELSDVQRTDLLEQLNLVSGEAAIPPENRKTGVIKPVLSGLATGLNAVASLAKVWSLTGDLICGYFGVENPLKPSQ
jgi:hypothetical protein